MSDSPLPPYPGGPDTEPSQRDRHKDSEYDISWVRVAVFLAVAVASVYYLTLLTIRVVPMPVLV